MNNHNNKLIVKSGNPTIYWSAVFLITVFGWHLIDRYKPSPNLGTAAVFGTAILSLTIPNKFRPVYVSEPKRK